MNCQLRLILPVAQITMTGMPIRADCKVVSLFYGEVSSYCCHISKPVCFYMHLEKRKESLEKIV